MTPNARFQRLALMAMAVAFILLPLAAASAPPDDKAIAATDRTSDGAKPHKPPVLVPDRRNPEIEALQKELRRLRAEVERCMAKAGS